MTEQRYLARIHVEAGEHDNRDPYYECVVEYPDGTCIRWELEPPESYGALNLQVDTDGIVSRI